MGITIDEVLEGAEKLFGSRSVMKLTDKSGLDVPVQRTGVPPLDVALGVGGLPKGRIVEIYGPESSGKTSLALSTIAQAQKDGAWAWYGDMEHSLDPSWAEQIGVDLDKLLISQPNCGEDCLDLADYFIDSGVIDIIVIDSVASLVSKAELQGDAGAAHVGLQARLMSQAMRRQTARISRTDCIAIYINQIREKIGVKFGSPETTPGGRALKFYSSIRLDVRRTEHFKQGEKILGNTTKITVKKNKVAPPHKIADARLLFENGFDLASNLLKICVDNGIIEKDKNTYSYNGEILAVGKVKAMKALNELDDELENIYKKLIGDVIQVKRDKKDQKKKDKVARLHKRYLEADEEDKEFIGKKIKKLGGELPEVQ